jgi:hypothetical protein
MRVGSRPAHACIATTGSVQIRAGGRGHRVALRSGAAPLNRASHATIAFLESDRPARPEPAMPMATRESPARLPADERSAMDAIVAGRRSQVGEVDEQQNSPAEADATLLLGSESDAPTAASQVAIGGSPGSTRRVRRARSRGARPRPACATES